MSRKGFFARLITALLAVLGITTGTTANEDLVKSLHKKAKHDYEFAGILLAIGLLEKAKHDYGTDNNGALNRKEIRDQSIPNIHVYDTTSKENIDYCLK